MFPGGAETHYFDIEIERRFGVRPALLFGVDTVLERGAHAFIECGEFGGRLAAHVDFHGDGDGNGIDTGSAFDAADVKVVFGVVGTWISARRAMARPMA